MQKMTVSCLPTGGLSIERREIELLGQIDLSKLASVRTPGVHKAQKHIPGFFWMEQAQDLVWYESRLEMMILKTLDHERDVETVVSQPFLLSFSQDGLTRTHVPDFLILFKDAPPLLVNVKPKRYLDSPRNARSFAACQHLAERLNWEYVTRAEPPPEYATNINWLNGYKRRPFALDQFREELLSRVVGQVSVGTALQGLEPAAFARPVLFYLMWRREISFDAQKVLSDDTVLSPGAVQ